MMKWSAVVFFAFWISVCDGYGNFYNPAPSYSSASAYGDSFNNHNPNGFSHNNNANGFSSNNNANGFNNHNNAYGFNNNGLSSNGLNNNGLSSNGLNNNAYGFNNANGFNNYHATTVPPAVQDVAMQLMHHHTGPSYGNAGFNTPNTGSFLGNNLASSNQYSTNFVNGAGNHGNQFPQQQQPLQQQYPLSSSGGHPGHQQKQSPSQWEVVPTVSSLQFQEPAGVQSQFQQPQVHQTLFQNNYGQTGFQQPQVQTPYQQTQLQQPQYQQNLGQSQFQSVQQPQGPTQQQMVQPLQVQTQFQPTVQTIQPKHVLQTILQPQTVLATQTGTMQQVQHLQQVPQVHQVSTLQQVSPVQHVQQVQQLSPVQQIITNSLNQNTLAQTQYDPQTTKFLSMIKPLMEPEPTVHPTTPSLYFVMPNNMIAQYPNAVVIATGEPQPGYSIVKWSPDSSQVTHKVEGLKRTDDAKAYDYSNDYEDNNNNKYQYGYDGSDYDYKYANNAQKSPKQYQKKHNVDNYNYNNGNDDYYDYDYGSNDFQYNSNAPGGGGGGGGGRQRMQQGRGRGRSGATSRRRPALAQSRGRYGNDRLSQLRRQIQERKRSSSVPMYMRFAKAFGRGDEPTPRGRGRPNARRPRRPSLGRPNARSSGAPRSRSRFSPRSRPQNQRTMVKGMYVSDPGDTRAYGDYEGEGIGHLKDSADVVYQYEYVSAHGADDGVYLDDEPNKKK